MPSYASQSSVSSVGGEGTVFKITIERTRDCEMRRVRGTFSFEEMQSIVRHMWNSAPKRLSIEYVDDEGDRIRIGSELEWNEAIQQHAEKGERTVRLFARRGQRNRRATAEDDSTDTESEQRPSSTEKALPAVPCDTKEPSPPTSAAPAVEGARVAVDPVPAPEVLEPPTTPAPSAGSTEGTEQHDDTLELLSRLFECDAGKEMVNMFSRVDFSPVVTRRVDPVAQEIQVDVDKAALRHLTVARTNLWIGQGLYEKAECALAAAIRVWPGDTIFEFNAACSASLRGDLTSALAHLRSAVEHGYTNIQQLKRDPDLARVRTSPEFASVLVLARGQPTATASEPAPRLNEPKVETDVDKLLAVMPHLAPKEAEAVMKRYRGDLSKAVNFCLRKP